MGQRVTRPHFLFTGTMKPSATINAALFVGLLLVATEASAQQMTQRFWQPRSVRLDALDSAGAPGNNLVWKTDGSGVPGWRTDATAGGPGGDVDEFATDPTSNA